MEKAKRLREERKKKAINAGQETIVGSSNGKLTMVNSLGFSRGQPAQDHSNGFGGMDSAGFS